MFSDCRPPTRRRERFARRAKSVFSDTESRTWLRCTPPARADPMLGSKNAAKRCEDAALEGDVHSLQAAGEMVTRLSEDHDGIRYRPPGRSRTARSTLGSV